MLAVVLVLGMTPNAQARPRERSGKSVAAYEAPEWVPFQGSYPVTSTVNAQGQHNGRAGAAIDFGLPNGTEVRSAGRGTVTSAGRDSCVGYYVTIYHRTANRTSSYFHLSSVGVAAGRTVGKGTVIGRSGQPASSDCGRGYHLHYQEIPGRVTGTTVSGRLSPGVLNACVNGRRVLHQFGPALAGRTVVNSGYDCPA